MSICNLPLDIINFIGSFLQRTDQISCKITNKHMLTNFNITMSLNDELNLYTKTIDNLSYAWKGDTRYINIYTYKDNTYDILKKYAIVNNLWYFDFNAEFIVYPGIHVILFLTTIKNYDMNFELIDDDNNVKTFTLKPRNGGIELNIDKKSKMTINCRNINTAKYNETVQYMLCMPKYYFDKLKGYKTINENGHKITKIANWKKQIYIRVSSSLGQKYSLIKFF